MADQLVRGALYGLRAPSRSSTKMSTLTPPGEMVMELETFPTNTNREGQAEVIESKLGLERLAEC